VSDVVPLEWYRRHTMLRHSYDFQCRCPDCCQHERNVASNIAYEKEKKKSGVRSKTSKEILMSGFGDNNPNAW